MINAALTTALALVLAACGQSPEPTASAEDAAAIPPATTAAAGTEYIAGTGDATAPAEPATDEVATTPGSDAEDTQYFDFSGDALARIRADARPATPDLRDAARRIVDATGEERGCGTHPEGERLFMLDLDGEPGEEALLLYTMEGCENVANYYDRNGYVLRQVEGDWQQVGDFSLGTRLVGPAHISSITDGRLVVTPEDDSMAQAAEVVIAP
ncbi:hypothetical protein [Luteimonas terricola]|uniref:Uncharacterized protein n=1 Tax=Luteimonas terricola TaxID=645597 RepID=A0ABQ2E9X3_9GAMM|nr:hypothetical protein [Luteimonas terricola]GGJ99198.1 hypothetical protein GCM10011394_05400 [Luteimonas terricola]